MIRTHNAAAIMLITAGLIVSGFLSSGCKKTQPAGPALSAPAQPSTSMDKGSHGPEAIPQEALRYVQQGIEHTRLREYDKAIKEFSAAIEQYPQYVMAYS